MATENFDRAEKFTIDLESKSSIAKDVGDGHGMTKYGITEKDHPGVDVKNLTLDQAKGIYRKEYWDHFGCDDLPYPLDCIHFDTAVNMYNKAPQILAQSGNDPAKYLSLRTERYRSIAAANPDKQKYLNGWLNRVCRLKVEYLPNV